MTIDPPAMPVSEGLIDTLIAEINSLNAQLEAEREKVKGHIDNGNRLMAAADSWRDECLRERKARKACAEIAENEYNKAVERANSLQQRLASVEAKLDAVMLEYCPEEMTKREGTRVQEISYEWEYRKP